MWIIKRNWIVGTCYESGVKDLHTQNWWHFSGLSGNDNKCVLQCTYNTLSIVVSGRTLNSLVSPLHTHTQHNRLLLFWNMSGTTRVSRYQNGKTRKVKTNQDLLEQEIVSGSGISWTICKSAPHPRQPRQHPTTQFFTGRMPFLLPNQQRQSTEGT